MSPRRRPPPARAGSRPGRGARAGADRGSSRLPQPARSPRSPLVLAAAPDLRHPAFVLAASVAAACIVVSVSFALYDTDMWQHLAVGRAIWTLHAFPTRQLWTWPTYGAPDVNASWGFRLLIWPLWRAFGVPGLFAWRWFTTLAAFGLMWAAARRMGARGLAPLLVLVWCSLVYRQRSQIRPETLTAVLLAAEIWILERRRNAEPGSRPAADLTPWLIVIAWVWANAHISYWMGLAVQGLYLVGDRRYREARGGGLLAHWGLDRWKGPLAVLAASIAISFVNPWGWRALWQPFDYFLNWRHELIFRSIGELQPIDWHFNTRNGLALLLVLWPVLALWRARRAGLDAVELALIALSIALALPSERFVGFLALVAAPFLGRDLDAWVRSRNVKWIPRAVAPRALLAALACVSIGIPEWNMRALPLKIGFEMGEYPVRACDFIEAHGVRGRSFNLFAAGGYMVYRFWPDRTRLPFMDIHQAGTPRDRYAYVWAQQDSNAWHELDTRYRFGDVLMFTRQQSHDHLLDYVSAEPATYALVFSDDAAALFLRRDGPYAALIDSFEYRVLPGGFGRLHEVMTACEADTAMRRRFEAECERSIASSPWNSRARTLLARLTLLDHQQARAVELLTQALRVNPMVVNASEYLGVIALAHDRAREALHDFEREIENQGEDAVLDFEVARCWARIGDPGRARSFYARAVRLGPDQTAARDSLAALAARARR
jgi:hypothetical protein